MITTVLAFCSIAYELILAQALSAFLENTVLRYSVTIGLYMFSMGIGSLMAEGRITRRPVLNMLRIEALLTLLGGLSVLFLFSLSEWDPSRMAFTLFAHGLIVLIGILTGFEIPLLIVIANQKNPQSEDSILMWDYVGAFFATIVFAFYFYPYMGLIHASFFIGVLNAVCGIALSNGTFVSSEERKHLSFRINQVVLFCCLALISGCLIFANPLSDFLIAQYVQ